MATPKKRYKYTFLYTDQTYLTYELTREDFEKVEQGLTGTGDKNALGLPRSFVAVSIGVIGLDGVRSVIEQKEEEPEEEQEQDQDKMSGLPALDQTSYNWIKEMMGGDK